MADLLLSEKYKAFLRCDAPVEFLEGTTAAGKTTVGLFKFMLKVAESPKKIHILSGLDLGTVEKNIITKELGMVQCFEAVVEVLKEILEAIYGIEFDKDTIYDYIKDKDRELAVCRGC